MREIIWPALCHGSQKGLSSCKTQGLGVRIFYEKAMHVNTYSKSPLEGYERIL